MHRESISAAYRYNDLARITTQGFQNSWLRLVICVHWSTVLITKMAWLRGGPFIALMHGLVLVGHAISLFTLRSLWFEPTTSYSIIILCDHYATTTTQIILFFVSQSKSNKIIFIGERNKGSFGFFTHFFHVRHWKIKTQGTDGDGEATSIKSSARKDWYNLVKKKFLYIWLLLPIC